MSADVGCVASLGHSRRIVSGIAGAVAAFLALNAADLGIQQAKAQTAVAEAPRTDAAWCLQRNIQGEPPTCIYETLPSCFLAGFRDGGYCISNPGPAAAQAATPSADQAQRRRAARAAAPQTQKQTQTGAVPAQDGQAPRRRRLSDAEREKLFKDFQSWREQRAETKKQ